MLIPGIKNVLMYQLWKFRLVILLISFTYRIEFHLDIIMQPSGQKNFKNSQEIKIVKK